MPPAVQAPPPLQYPVAVPTPLLHVATEQTVVVPGAAPHAAMLEPSQIAAHEPPAPVHFVRALWGWPPMTAVHVPMFPETSHAWH